MLSALTPPKFQYANVFKKSVIASRSAVKFDTTPIVSWNDNIEPLVQEHPQTQPSATANQLASPPSSQTSLPMSNVGLPRFPVNNLAPPQPQPEPYIPPTPPMEPIDDVDEMDWTPSQQVVESTFIPPRIQPPDIRGPSPFQGQLPAAPTPPSWQLRNPISQKPSTLPLGNKPNPFDQAPSLQPTTNLNQEKPKQDRSREPIMAPPRFFPPSDFATDTGLESLFDRTFSLADDPSEVKNPGWSETAAIGGRALLRNPSNRSSSILKSSLLLMCLVLWAFGQIFSLPGHIVETSVLGITFLVAGFSLLESLMRPILKWSATDVLLSFLELVACGCLVKHLGLDTYVQYRFDKVEKCLVAFMAGQEMISLRLSALQDASNSDSTEHSKTQPSIITKNKMKEESPRKRENLTYSSSNNLHSSNNNNSFQNDFKGAGTFGNSNNNNIAVQNKSPSNSLLDSSALRHPSPFSAIPRPQPLSFSSFGSALPDNIMAPSSPTSVTSTSYAPSTISDPPSPLKRSTTPRGPRGGPGPAIGGLSLNDSPTVPRTTRYALRKRA